MGIMVGGVAVCWIADEERLPQLLLQHIPTPGGPATHRGGRVSDSALSKGAAPISANGGLGKPSRAKARPRTCAGPRAATFGCHGSSASPNFQGRPKDRSRTQEATPRTFENGGARCLRPLAGGSPPAGAGQLLGKTGAVEQGRGSPQERKATEEGGDRAQSGPTGRCRRPGASSTDCSFQLHAGHPRSLSSRATSAAARPKQGGDFRWRRRAILAACAAKILKSVANPPPRRIGMAQEKNQLAVGHSSGSSGVGNPLGAK